jgi:hypothetical protein
LDSRAVDALVVGKDISLEEANSVFQIHHDMVEACAQLRLCRPKLWRRPNYSVKQISLVEIACGKSIRFQPIKREWYQEYQSYPLPYEQPKVFRRKLHQRDAHEPKTRLD